MKPINLFTIGLVAFALFLAAWGSVMAQTTINGDMSQVDSFVWTISSDSVDGILVPGEVQTTTTYSEKTHGQDGQTNYFKNFNIYTGNANLGQNNVDSRRIFSFDGTAGQTGNGRMTSDESIGVDTMGMPDTLSGWPAFHNTVLAGSSLDLLRGSVATTGQARTVSANPNTPLSLTYNINLHGLPDSTGTTLPAIGSATAFMNGHLEQGRGNSTQKASDLVFSHQSGASGLINVFSKNMNYESGPNQMVW
jgi:hypothetical protein